MDIIIIVLCTTAKSKTISKSTHTLALCTTWPIRYTPTISPKYPNYFT